jgi:hypothetical protein
MALALTPTDVPFASEGRSGETSTDVTFFAELQPAINASAQASAVAPLRAPYRDIMVFPLGLTAAAPAAAALRS